MRFSSGALQPELPARRRDLLLHHQLPRVLHGAGPQQPGRGVPQAAQRDHRGL